MRRRTPHVSLPVHSGHHWLDRLAGAQRRRLDRIKHGLVLTCVGDSGGVHYKRTRRGNAAIDRAVALVLGIGARTIAVLDFFPYGYDERQYCSPGFRSAGRVLHAFAARHVPEYHTSADNLTFVSSDKLEQSLETLWSVVHVIERDRVCLNLSPKGEPQLGKRGLFQGLSGSADRRQHELALLWVFNQSDGSHGLLSIAERAGMPFDVISRAADALTKGGLLKNA